uniref:Putative succinyl-CoA:3-ketoacid coenzyme A transferase subunit B n=1 Tax=uncultured Dehalococcoidia bacterium TaxID=498747 RepID=A0A871YEE8_9CHLR|nr:putative succinyl-CoA:3-ketoacid coenzyme A transferase subunit B [uncultured Dehalococcoidia bacterium]
MPKVFEGLPREMIAMRISREIKDGDYVNLGIGIPTLISNWIEGRDIALQAENGMLKTGPLADGCDVDQDLINASCQPVCPLPGSSYFDIVESFAMIRGGRMNVVVMGALQANDKGDYAGWANPERGLDIGNVGGSMDLCAGARKLILAMEHCTKNGDPKIVKKVSYPLTTIGKVNMIFTDLAVMEITKSGLLLKEIFPGMTVEELQSVTEPKLIVSPDLKEIEL